MSMLSRGVVDFKHFENVKSLFENVSLYIGLIAYTAAGAKVRQAQQDSRALVYSAFLKKKYRRNSFLPAALSQQVYNSLFVIIIFAAIIEKELIRAIKHINTAV